LKGIFNQWKLRMKDRREECVSKWTRTKQFIRQRQHVDDRKRVFNWLINDNIPMCEIPTEEFYVFFSNRWTKNEHVNRGVAESVFKLR
jgi:hypothetical protein